MATIAAKLNYRIPKVYPCMVKSKGRLLSYKMPINDKSSSSSLTYVFTNQFKLPNYLLFLFSNNPSLSMSFPSSIQAITFGSSSSKYHVNYDGKTIETTVTNKASTIRSWVNDIFISYAGKPKVVVGLDVEWRPPTYPSMSNKSATLQLCIDKKCLIIQLFYLDTIPMLLKTFLMDSKFTFVGVQVEEDILKLKNEYGLDCAKSADVRAESIKRWPFRYFRKPGLKHSARDVAGLYMEKPMDVCRSNWDTKVLSERQVEYACIDAYASYKIAHKLFLDG